MKEIEVKYRLASHQALEKVLLKRGIALSEPVTQDDHADTPAVYAQLQEFVAGLGIEAEQIEAGYDVLLHATMKHDGNH